QMTARPFGNYGQTPYGPGGGDYAQRSGVGQYGMGGAGAMGAGSYMGRNFGAGNPWTGGGFAQGGGGGGGAGGGGVMWWGWAARPRTAAAPRRSVSRIPSRSASGARWSRGKPSASHWTAPWTSSGSATATPISRLRCMACRCGPKDGRPSPR